MLVPIGDVDAMAEALTRIVTDAALRDTMTANALARAQHYGIEQSNRRFAACVSGVLVARRDAQKSAAPAQRVV
jgi:glycosyltransferase involved in cell wall biosynthesis